jgi:hypothetical protein
LDSKVFGVEMLRKKIPDILGYFRELLGFLEEAKRVL